MTILSTEELFGGKQPAAPAAPKPKAGKRILSTEELLGRPQAAPAVSALTEPSPVAERRAEIARRRTAPEPALTQLPAAAGARPAPEVAPSNAQAAAYVAPTAVPMASLGAERVPTSRQYREATAPVERVPPPERTGLTPTQGALPSYLRSAARTGVGIVADIPRSVATARAAGSLSRLSLYDRLDRHEPIIDVAKTPTGQIDYTLLDILRTYVNATPEGKATLRQRETDTLDPSKHPLSQAAQAMETASEEFVGAPDPARAEEFGTKVAEGAGSLAGFMLPGATVGRVLRIPSAISTAGMGALVNAQGQFEDAIRKGASLETAFQAFAAGIPGGLTEAVPMARWLDRLDKATKGKVRSKIATAIKEGGEEFTQEWVQSITNDAVAAGLYDPERDIALLPGMEEGIAGGLGAVMGLLTSALPGRQRGATERPTTQPGAQAADRQARQPVVVEPQQPVAAQPQAQPPVQPGKPKAKPPSPAQAASDLKASVEARTILQERNQDGHLDAQIAAIDRNIAEAEKALAAPAPQAPVREEVPAAPTQPPAETRATERPAKAKGYVIDELDPDTGTVIGRRHFPKAKTAAQAADAFDELFPDESGPLRRATAQPLTESPPAAVTPGARVVTTEQLLGQRPAPAAPAAERAAPPPATAQAGPAAPTAAVPRLAPPVGSKTPGLGPKPRRRTGPPRDLFQAIEAMGGIRDEGGELAAILGKGSPAYRRLVKQTGKSVGEATEALSEARYFGSYDAEGYFTRDPNEFFEALGRQARGQKVYSEYDLSEVLEREEAAKAREGEAQIKDARASVRREIDRRSVRLSKAEFDHAVNLVLDRLPVDEAVDDAMETFALAWEAKNAHVLKEEPKRGREAPFPDTPGAPAARPAAAPDRERARAEPGGAEGSAAPRAQPGSGRPEPTGARPAEPAQPAPDEAVKDEPPFQRARRADVAAPASGPRERVRLAPDVVAETLKSLDPKARQIVEHIATLAERITPGARVRLYERLLGPGFEGRGVVTDAGFTQVVNLALRPLGTQATREDLAGTFRHEAIHWLRQTGVIPDADWRILERAAEQGNWIERHGIAEAYPDLSREGQIEEAVAERFRTFLRGPEALPDAVRPVFRRLAFFFRQIAAQIRSVFGARATANDILSGIEAGRLQRDRLGRAGIGRTAFQKRATTDETAQGTQQVIPGTERITDRELIERKSEGPKTAKKPQKDIGDLPLFDTEGPKQGSLFARADMRDTPEFKRWFGRSVVTDESGNPLVVYHGTQQEFESFDRRATVDGGFHFGTEAQANMRAAGKGKTLIPAYIKIENPRRSRDMGGQWKSKIASAKAAGHDGIAYLNRYEGVSTESILQAQERGIDLDRLSDAEFKKAVPEARDSYIAFDPSQIRRADKEPKQGSLFQRAAIGPGLFGNSFEYTSPQVRDELLRSASATIANLWTKGVTKFDLARIKAQDRMLALKRVQQAISGQRDILATPTPQNAYLAEELYHGIVGTKLDEFRTERVEPLIKAIAGRGLTIEQVNDFLYARHAPERNAQIAGINEDMPDGGSGMTNAEAEAAMERYRSAGLYDRLNEAASLVDQINTATLDTLTRGDLIDAETRIKWRQTYKHYVPLRGWEAPTEEMTGDVRDVIEGRPQTGRGFDIRGQESKRAMGRASRAGDILAHVIAQHEEAVVRAEKNKVAKAFLRLVEANPNMDLWEVGVDTAQRRIDPTTGMVTFGTNPMLVNQPNVLAAKIGGEVHYITIHDAGLARAMKNLGVESAGGAIRALSKVMRYFAAINTQYNPAFTIPNIVRDVQTAMVNIQAEDVPDKGKLAGAIVRDIPKAMRGAFGGSRGRQDTEWQRHYREFSESGGRISFFGLDDVETRAKKLRNMLGDAAGGRNVRQGLRYAGQLISDVNGAVENATRLAVYANLRRRGVSKEKASSIARNLTVNFNRKGEIGQVLNSLYLFYNAALQGNYQMVKAIARSRRVQGIVVGSMIVGALLEAMNAALSPDDDKTGEKLWDQIGDYDKAHNWLIINPWATSKDELVAAKIPLPYGYNVFPYMGALASELVRGKPNATAGKAAAQTIGAAFDAFNPLGGSGPLWWAPTLTKPGAEVIANVTFTGAPLMPAKESFGQTTPDHERYFRSVRVPSKWAAEKINELTGGSKFVEGGPEGIFSFSPETFDHFIDFAGGGLGRVLAMPFDEAIRLRTGETKSPLDWPVISRFTATKKDWYVGQRYRELSEMVTAVRKTVELAEEEGDRALARRWRQDNPVESDPRVLLAFKRADRRLGAMYRGTPKPERDAKFEAQIRDVQAEAIRVYIEALQRRR